MKRTAEIYRSSTIYEKRHVCFDEECAHEILDLMENPKVAQKLNYIFDRILEQRFIYYDDYVKIEDGISEMRIFPNGMNARIYCKEVKSEEGDFFVIAAKLLPKKKSRKINKEIQQLIDPIKKYEYTVNKH